MILVTTTGDASPGSVMVTKQQRGCFCCIVQHSDERDPAVRVAVTTAGSLLLAIVLSFSARRRRSNRSHDVAAGRMEDDRKLMAECLRLAPTWSCSTAIAPQWFRSTKLRAELWRRSLRRDCPNRPPFVAPKGDVGEVGDLYGLTQDALQMICPAGKAGSVLLRSRIWSTPKSVARKLRFDQAFQRDLGRPACCAKICRFPSIQIRGSIAPSRPDKRGGSRVVTNAGRDAVDARASGAMCVRRAVFRERTLAAQDERR